MAKTKFQTEIETKIKQGYIMYTFKSLKKWAIHKISMKHGFYVKAVEEPTEGWHNFNEHIIEVRQPVSNEVNDDVEIERERRYYIINKRLFTVLYFRKIRIDDNVCISKFFKIFYNDYFQKIYVNSSDFINADKKIEDTLKIAKKHTDFVQWVNKTKTKMTERSKVFYMIFYYLLCMEHITKKQWEVKEKPIAKEGAT